MKIQNDESFFPRPKPQKRGKCPHCGKHLVYGVCQACHERILHEAERLLKQKKRTE